jgi:hypothetical protein
VTRQYLVNNTALQLHYYFAWPSNLRPPLLLFIGRLNHSGCHQDALWCLNSSWSDWLQQKLYWYDIWPCIVQSQRHYLNCSIFLFYFFTCPTKGWAVAQLVWTLCNKTGGSVFDSW